MVPVKKVAVTCRACGACGEAIGSRLAEVREEALKACRSKCQRPKEYRRYILGAVPVGLSLWVLSGLGQWYRCEVDDKAAVAVTGPVSRDLVLCIVVHDKSVSWVRLAKSLHRWGWRKITIAHKKPKEPKDHELWTPPPTKKRKKKAVTR